MSLELNLQFEKAIRLLVDYFPESEATSRKPALFHDLRVGVYLYERNYHEQIVLAGVLHDALEWSAITEEMLVREFGRRVTDLVIANSKNDEIVDKQQKTTDLIRRCVAQGESALIIKAADILDSFKWYTSQKNQDQLEYCRRTAREIFVQKPESFVDPVFEELKKFLDKPSNQDQV